MIIGPNLQEPDMVNSPGGTRRRRSRIPSEEDDQLINFLVTGQNDGKSDKNLSVGNLVAESQQNYGSLDRGLMRRSRFVIDFYCSVKVIKIQSIILFSLDLIWVWKAGNFVCQSCILVHP